MSRFRRTRGAHQAHIRSGAGNGGRPPNRAGYAPKDACNRFPSLELVSAFSDDGHAPTLPDFTLPQASRYVAHLMCKHVRFAHDTTSAPADAGRLHNQPARACAAGLRGPAGAAAIRRIRRVCAAYAAAPKDEAHRAPSPREIFGGWWPPPAASQPSGAHPARRCSRRTVRAAKDWR